MHSKTRRDMLLGFIVQGSGFRVQGSFVCVVLCVCVCVCVFRVCPCVCTRTHARRMLTCIAQAGAKMYLHGRACQERKRIRCASAFCTSDPHGITALLFIRARSQARSLSLLSRSLFLDPSVTGIRSAARASGMFLPSTPRGSQSTRQAPSRRTLLLRQLAQRRRADGRRTRPLKSV